MKVTAIKQQVKQKSRYSIFIDDKYAFSLSEGALLESKLASGQELSGPQVKDFKKLSDDDKLYNLTLRYVAMRPRSRWEVETYLERKKASPEVATKLLNKLSNVGLLDDQKFAESFVNDRRLLRHTSRRKLIQELRQKRVADEIIQAAVGNDAEVERESLGAIVERKRKQSKYQDDLKLMQYLARQGFNYGDIKAALQSDNEG